ncbi:MAG: helix-turn-helix domain-containing protein, partial [Prevotella sp.]|nr:helix-turn-helix domain-containing protein [Prevotella sp.]
IHSNVEDNMQNIWIGTSFGITKLEIDKGRVTAVRSYMYHDNVPNESFVNGRAMKLADGTIVMQSLDHVVAFNPASFHTEQIRSLRLFPKLIRVLVNGNSVMAGTQIDGKLIMERAVTRTREINVNYNQNSISLTFSALNYFRPIQTYYRYRIKGVSGEWRVVSYFDGGETVDNQGLLHLILLGLRPGTYQVELQASMEDGDWTTEPYVWIINVDEPWWRTTGVYLSMGLLILGFLVLNFIWFNRNMRLRLRRNNDEADLLKRIKNFVERCDSYGGEVLAPKPENGGDNAEESGMDSEFVEAMLRVVPYVNKNADRRLTMHELATTAGVELPRFYELISANLYKNPRQLAQTLRLQRAAEMLRTTDMSIEDIANECGFVTPNYFIAGFFHHFGATPQDYRNTAPR